MTRNLFACGTLPDFLVIGAQKAGTTYLYQNLLQHPLAHGAHKREVSYFNTEASQGGAEEYRRHFPPRNSLPEGSVVGEKSPGYLSTPEAAERAARVVPDAKVIVLLRNPVDRAYSHYQHVAMKLGAEPLSFEDAIEAEPERLAASGRKAGRFAYLSRGLYADQLPRWHELFGWERVLVIQSEEMYRRPRRILRQLCEFLGLPAHDFALQQKGKKINRNSGRYEVPMRPETRERLAGYFEPHNRRLYEYLGRDFDW